MECKVDRYRDHSEFEYRRYKQLFAMFHDVAKHSPHFGLWLLWLLRFDLWFLWLRVRVDWLLYQDLLDRVLLFTTTGVHEVDASEDLKGFLLTPGGYQEFGRLR